MAEVNKVFGAAYVEWLEARAAMAKRNADIDQPEEPPGDDPTDDPTTREMEQRIIDAERQMIASSVSLKWQLVDKFEVLKYMMTEAHDVGVPSDNRHLLMLESVHADLIELRNA